MSGDWNRLVAEARRVADALVRSLPPPLREHAGRLTIQFAKRPGRALVADGVESDIMGLFEGCSLLDDEPLIPELSPRITLFLSNILDEAGGDPLAFKEEVRTTLLHELGHYLGLDEDGLFDRNLE